MFMLIAYDSDEDTAIEETRLFTSLEAAKDAASIDYPEWAIYTIDVDTGEEPEWVTTSWYSHRTVTWTDVP